MTNKWIEFVKNYSKIHNMKYNEVLKSSKAKEEYKNKKQKGSGIVDSIVSKSKSVVKDKLKNVVKNVVNNKVDDVIDTVVGKGVLKKTQKGKGKLNEIKDKLLNDK